MLSAKQYPIPELAPVTTAIEGILADVRLVEKPFVEHRILTFSSAQVSQFGHKQTEETEQ